MKKSFLRVISFAATAALIAVGCGDDGVQNKSTEVGDFVNMFTTTGGDGGGKDSVGVDNTRYTLTVNVTPNNSGTVSRNPSGTSYTAGSQVTVTATESNGYKFTGWTGASNDTTATVTIIMDGNQTLTANFISTAVATYTLTVNVAPTGGGIVSREPNKTRYNAGEKVTVTAGILNGYTFTGWTGDVNEMNGSVTVTMNGDITLTANFKQNTYTLSVNASPTQGGTVSREPNKAVYTYGEQVTVTATPASGYAFNGWTDSWFSSSNSTVTITIDGNKTLTAKFQQQTTTYTLTTEVSPTGGGSVSRSPDLTSYTSGATVTVTAIPASGYSFDRWSGASTSTNTSVTVTMDGNKTLTAGFRLLDTKRFTIYFNGNGTTAGVPLSVSVDSGTVITLPDQGNMTRNGYYFGGWNTNSSGTGTNYYGYGYTVTGNVTLYAKWTAYPTYTVTYNGNGNTSGNIATIQVTSGSIIKLPDQGTLVKTGYDFSGWNTNSSGTGINYNVGSEYIVTSNVTLYAKWTIQTCVVMYGGNGADYGNTPVFFADYGSTITLLGEGYLGKTGYNFGGWNTNPDGTGTNYAANSSYMVTGSVTFYANWIIITHTLTTDVSPSGGGNVSRSPNQTSYASGTRVTVTATAASGYTFTGWSGASTSTSSSVTITMNGDGTLTAHFQQVHTLTTGVSPTGGGSVSRSPNQSSYTSGTSVTVTATATSGYTFTGWSGASTSTSSSVTITMNGDKELTANFMENNKCGTDGTAGSCKKVVIGGKTWMGENLNVETADSWCYGNDPANCDKYGRLYTWSAAMTACPAGWRLPDTADWRRLVEVAGGQSTAGKKLKSVTGWNSYSGFVNTDDFGFSALPGGYRNSNGSFDNVGYYGYWWTATEYSSGYAYYRRMDFNDDNVYEYYNAKEFGNSVRCVED